MNRQGPKGRKGPKKFITGAAVVIKIKPAVAAKLKRGGTLLTWLDADAVVLRGADGAPVKGVRARFVNAHGANCTLQMVAIEGKR